MKNFSIQYSCRVLTGLLMLIGAISCNQQSTPDDDIIWYSQPAAIWEEALPVGNGQIGAMVFGKTDTERIQLNDDSMWPANMDWDEPAGTSADLQTIRQLIMDGRVQEADRMIIEKFSRKDINRSHQTLGELFIDLNHDSITGYRRQLNISEAVAKVSYNTHGHLFTQTVFASHPHGVIVIKLTTESPLGINGRIVLQRPPDQGIATATTIAHDSNRLIMSGMVTQRGGVFDSKPFPIEEGVRFETHLLAQNRGGTVTAENDYLVLSGVKEATLLLASGSSYYHENYPEMALQAIQKASSQSFYDMLASHIADHQQFYDRVNLSLEGNHPDTIPTDQRIEMVKNGATDVGLEELLFQYGRYLLIASSRPGTNPANLQGLWNQHISAPWNADYHLNINLQMNYWLADVTNLGELNGPLFDYVDKLVENGKNTAMQNFGCRGSFLPHATDLWAPTWLQASTAYWGASFGAAGWMMQHYWQHFAFTVDTTFLQERAYPALHEVTQFYSDWIIEDPRDGTLVSAPSSSPENQYLAPNGQPAALCMGTAFDQQIIAEVFDNYLETCRILGIDNELAETIRQQRPRLRPGFVTGSDGRILEWDREYAEPEPGHRHMSHLYGFHPGVAVTQSSHAELFEAVHKTLDYRLANGGAGTGWSRAWLINCAARLLDGSMAHEHIQFFITRSTYPNLFCSHPPYQIDGNFGVTAGIAEMLIQSHEPGIIRILPALPQAWNSGKVTGLKARGGYTIDIEWENGLAVDVKLHSPFQGKIQLMINDDIVIADLKKGEVFQHTL